MLLSVRRGEASGPDHSSWPSSTCTFECAAFPHIAQLTQRFPKLFHKERLAHNQSALDLPGRSANVGSDDVSNRRMLAVPLQDADVKEITSRLDVLIKL